MSYHKAEVLTSKAKEVVEAHFYYIDYHMTRRVIINSVFEISCIILNEGKKLR